MLANIEREAARQSVNYVYNTVRATHPDRDGVHDCLAVRGYERGSSDTALRKPVRDEPDEAAAQPVLAPTGASTPLSARPSGMDTGAPERTDSKSGSRPAPNVFAVWLSSRASCSATSSSKPSGSTPCSR